MAWFARKDLEAKVTSLEAENAALKGEVEAAESKCKELQEVGGNAEELEKAKGAVSKAESALTAEQEAHKVTKKALEEEKAKTTGDALALLITEAHSDKADPANEKVALAVSSLVTAEIAKSGHPPIDLPAENNPGNTRKEGTMSHSDWSKMNPREKAEFFRKGGKLTDK